MAKDNTGVDRLLLPPLHQGGKHTINKTRNRAVVVRPATKADEIRVKTFHPALVSNKDFDAWDRAGRAELTVVVQPDYDGLAWRLDVVETAAAWA